MYFPDSQGKHPWDCEDWNEQCTHKKVLTRPAYFSQDAHGVYHGAPVDFVEVPREHLFIKSFSCFEDAKDWSIKLGLNFTPSEKNDIEYIEQCPHNGRKVNFEDSDSDTIIAIYEVGKNKYVRYEISLQYEYILESWYVNCDEVISEPTCIFADFTSDVRSLIDIYHSYIRSEHSRI
ncbi:hypothetical protein VCHA43P282_20011 [Vibrio chagasii]|nr:hypothetical protein VCHA43P282_20011 [Vibrio chagasii]